MYLLGALPLVSHLLGVLTHEKSVFCQQTKDAFFNDIRSLAERVIYLRYDIPCEDDRRLRRMEERIVYHADAKRLYIMRGNSCVYHIAQRYIIYSAPQGLFCAVWLSNSCFSGIIIEINPRLDEV